MKNLIFLIFEEKNVLLWRKLPKEKTRYPFTLLTPFIERKLDFIPVLTLGDSTYSMSTFGGFQGDEEEVEDLENLKTQMEQIQEHFIAVKDKEVMTQSKMNEYKEKLEKAKKDVLINMIKNELRKTAVKKITFFIFLDYRDFVGV